MQSVGVLICGYDCKDARTIKSFLDGTLDAYVIMTSASPGDDARVIDILRRKPADRFEEDETKVFVFVGFSEVQIHMVLEGFPGDGGLQRPIFCTLTGQNKDMPLRELVEHLAAEHRIWTAEN